MKKSEYNCNKYYESKWMSLLNIMKICEYHWND